MTEHVNKEPHSIKSLIESIVSLFMSFLLGIFFQYVGIMILILASNSVSTFVWLQTSGNGANSSYISLIESVLAAFPISVVLAIVDHVYITPLVAAFLATLGYVVFHRFPLWYLVVMLPLCTAALCVQSHMHGYLWSGFNITYVINLIPIVISYLFARRWLKRKTQS